MQRTKLTIAALALSAIACGDGDGPTAPSREITLSFCPGLSWAAYQNEGQAWTAFPSNPGEVTFAATDRLAIATVSGLTGPFVSPRLEIYYLTAEQVEARFTCADFDFSSGKRLQGAVAGVSQDASVYVSTGYDLAIVRPHVPTFQVRASRDGPIDIVAIHRPTPSDFPAVATTDKIIIRRNQDLADGATMPVFDFSSPESFALQANTLTIGGLPAGARVSIATSIATARSANGVLGYSLDQTGAVATTYSVPASRLAEGDVHQGFVSTTSKSIQFFYRSPADRTLALGPDVSTPVFATSTRPDEMLRVDVPSQPEYGSQIAVAFTPPQPATSSNTAVIRASKEYFGGTPTTWSLVLPNLNGVSGFAQQWGPASGGNAATLTVSNAPYGFSFAPGRDGDVYRSATTFRVITIGQ